MSNPCTSHKHARNSARGRQRLQRGAADEASPPAAAQDTKAQPNCRSDLRSTQ